MNITDKKYLLIICYGLGGASGLVFERLINEMSKYFKIDLILSASNEKTKLPEAVRTTVVNYVYIPKWLKQILLKYQFLENSGYIQINGYILKLIIKFLGFNPLNNIWSHRIVSKVKDKRYDLVFGLMDYNGFAPLIATCHVSQKLGVKSVVYSTDANPVPSYWDPDIKYLNKARKLLSKYYNMLDSLYFSNHVMANYEKGIFNFKEKTVLGSILTNSPIEKQSFPYSGSKMFLYTGSAWGPRKLDCLLSAFKKILNEHPDAELCFVGTKHNGFTNEELSEFTDKERQQIHSYPRLRCDELFEFYKNSCCFIDLNACTDDDPFLSSKITNYILYNRPIISQTGKFTPARYLFGGLDSIYICNHSPEEIYSAMRSVLKRQNCYDFGERDSLIEMFSVKSIVSLINKDFNVLLSY